MKTGRNMHQLLKSVSIGAMSLLLITAPVFMSAKKPSAVKQPENGPTSSNLSSSAALMAEAVVLYDSMKLEQKGLNEEAFEYAWKGYQYLLSKGLIARSEVLSICDFSQSSRKKRMYIIDVDDKKLLLNTYVAHGRKSGEEYATSFSNSNDSHKSSLGFYITRSTYNGGHGLSLKIDGVEKGINDHALARNIVVHGSDYVTEKFISGYKFAGRSFGCPAVPSRETKQVISMIKNGSCLFIYHPTKQYLTTSKILNS